MAELSREQFVDQVLQYVHEKFPLVKISRGKEPFSMLVNGHLASMENVYRMAVLQPDDVRHHIDPKPRLVATADAAVEQIDVRRDFGEQRIERLVEQFEPRQLGVAQIDHHIGALRGLDPRLPHRLLECSRLGRGFGRRSGLVFTAPHGEPILSAEAGMGQINDCFSSALCHGLAAVMP